MRKWTFENTKCKEEIDMSCTQASVPKTKSFCTKQSVEMLRTTFCNKKAGGRHTNQLHKKNYILALAQNGLRETMILEWGKY